jgi:hypothetical protein
MIIISKKSTGAGIHKLSELEIDVDKNWAGHSIGNLKGISYSGIFELTNWGTKFDVNGGILNILGEAGTVILNADQSFDITSTNAGITIGAKGDITVYPQPPSRLVLQGEGENLFRIERKGDPEKHVVDSIYHDDTLNLDIVGTRWAMKVGTTDYHIGLGLTYDNTNGIMHSGLISYLNDFEVFGKYGTGVGIHNYGIGISKESFIYPLPFGDVYNFAFMYGIDESNYGYTGIFGIGFSSSRRAFTEQNLRYVFYEKKDGGNLVDVGMILRGDITGIGHYTWKLNATEGMFFSTDRSVWLQSKELMWLRLVDEATATEYGGLYTDYIDYGYGYAEVYGQYGYLEFTNTDINLYSDTLNFNVNVAGSISLSGSEIGITSTSGDITLTTAGSIAMNLGNRKLSVFPVSDGIQIQPISGNLYLYATIGDLYFYGNTGIHLNYRELKEVGGISGDYGIVITTGSSFRINAIEVIIDHKPIYLDGDYKETAIIHDTNLDMIKFTKGIKVMGWGISVPTWTNSTRPSVPVGEYVIGFNTDTHQFEGWNGSTWVILG